MSTPRSIVLGPLKAPMMRLATQGSEVAGILVGRVEGDTAIAYYLHLARNVRESPVEFEAEPWHVVQAHVSAETYGLEVIGVFHTHPVCPPRPSARDVEGMKRWPYIWVIACSSDVEAWTPEAEPRPVEVL